MKYFAKIASMSLCSLLAAGCSSGNSPATDEVSPPATVEREKPAATSLPTPAGEPSDSDGLCPDESEPSPVEYRPSLAAWVDAADAIFVGTVTDVVWSTSPIYVQERPDGLGSEVFELRDVDECPADRVTHRAIEISFEDVVSITGVSLPESLSIRMSKSSAQHFPGIDLEEDGDVRSMSGGVAYLPGARVGGAIFEGDEGSFHWRYRQFEVLDGVVTLQVLPAPAAGCGDSEPVLTGIPDVYDGADWSSFESAIQRAPAPDATEARHENWLRYIRSRDANVGNSTRCTLGVIDDSSGPGDRAP